MRNNTFSIREFDIMAFPLVGTPHVVYAIRLGGTELRRQISYPSYEECVHVKHPDHTGHGRKATKAATFNAQPLSDPDEKKVIRGYR